MSVDQSVKSTSAGSTYAEAEVLALFPGDTGGERDLDARRLDVTSRIVGARTLHVGRVRKNPQRESAEAVPLRQEIVPAVIADLVDHAPVHAGSPRARAAHRRPLRRRRPWPARSCRRPWRPSTNPDTSPASPSARDRRACPATRRAVGPRTRRLAATRRGSRWLRRRTRPRRLRRSPRARAARAASAAGPPRG